MNRSEWGQAKKSKLHCQFQNLKHFSKPNQGYKNVEKNQIIGSKNRIITINANQSYIKLPQDISGICHGSGLIDWSD